MQNNVYLNLTLGKGTLYILVHDHRTQVTESTSAASLVINIFFTRHGDQNGCLVIIQNLWYTDLNKNQTSNK